jgi:glucosamine-6-phosphate deaminase
MSLSTKTTLREPMQLLWCDTPACFNSRAAEHVLAAYARNPRLSIALPTGLTPLGLYTVLRRREIALPGVRWFNLDDYVGLAAEHPLSYAHFLRVNLFEGLSVLESNIRLLHGAAPDLEAECRDYDRAIEQAGGLDLAILGLGANGHIAFNEPGASWDQATHVVELSEQTRTTNSRQQGDTVPALGITMGIGTVRSAREILLLVSGEAKREALRALRNGRPDPQWPVTSLLDHPALTVIADSGLR